MDPEMPKEREGQKEHHGKAEFKEEVVEKDGVLALPNKVFKSPEETVRYSVIRMTEVILERG